MIPTNLKSRPFDCRRAFSAAILCLPLAVLAQQAQPAAAGEEAVELPAVTVTGSNITGVDTDKKQPLTVYSRSEIERIGVGTFAELVEAMPFSTAVSINETDTGPNDARGDVSSINLRNLGAGRTLVLLNGRRLSAHGVTPGTPPVQFVNVNAIPLEAVQQVEVLRDGASAVYGSDAIGGVVNTVTRRGYAGFQAGVRLAFGDPAPNERTVTLGAGRIFNDGRTSVTAFIGVYDRRGLENRDRAYAASADKRPLFPGRNVSSNFNRASSSGPYGRFTAVTDSGSGAGVPGITAANGQFHYDPSTGARTAGAGPTAFYNSQASGWLLPDITRLSFLGSMEHRFGDAVYAFCELSYSDSHSYGGFDAIPISSGTDGIVIPKTNFHSPVGVRAGVPTPRDVLIRNYRVMEGGPRTYDTYSDNHRLLLGLRGTSRNSEWNWESAALHMRGHVRQVNHGYISVSRFLNQLSLATPDAYNPFGVPGSNPESVWRNFIVDIWDDGIGTLSSIDGKISGELLRLPAGAVSVATGFEARRESMVQRNDPFGLADDVVAQSEQIDVDASRNVGSVFAEVRVPLGAPDGKRPLLRELELRGAARYERYSSFDSLKPGIGFTWKPVQSVMVRGSFNEGFRAPTVVELHTPALGRRNEGIVDTSRDGQPDAGPSVSKRVVTGGNPRLQPEESKSYSFGVIAEPPWMKGLSIGADFFRIRQRNQIDNSDAQFELDLDAAIWAAEGGANPRVVREARTPADVAAGIPGLLIEVESTYQNLSRRETEGVDVFANYNGPRWSVGRFSCNAVLTHTRTLRIVDSAGVRTDLVGNGGNPRNKATVGISWRREGWSANVSERFIGGYRLSSAFTIDGRPWRMEDYSVTNASVGYRFGEGALRGVQARIGASNIFDEDPPFYPLSTAGYDSYYTDPRGRMLYVEIARRY